VGVSLWRCHGAKCAPCLCSGSRFG
jgi:hypothetical protein